MEKALAILVEVDDSAADCYLQQSIDTCMASPRMTFPEDEFWDCVDELPHLTDRVLFLHRQNGLSIEQIAKRLGIEQKEAARSEEHTSELQSLMRTRYADDRWK